MARSDYNDEDLDRALTDREERREWERLGEGLAAAGFIVLIAGVAIYAGASWLDQQFGWNLTGFLQDLVGSIFSKGEES